MSHNSRLGKFVMTAATDTWQEATLKPGQNIINARNQLFYKEHPAIKPSKNLLEAQLKARRLYKRICRYVS